MTTRPDEARYLASYLAKSDLQPPPPLLDRDGLISPPELAAFLSIPAATLRQWRYLGVGPRALRVGRHARYEPAEVRRWLAEECRNERRTA